ncbi:MAG TPA: YbaN family protein [Marinobacter sp.]|nr:YbaN family protein [Marinobacter sp.]
MSGHEGFAMAWRPGRTGFLILAYASMGLAIAGVVLPLLPTTPFVILAAFFASKGSPVFARWLEEHPTFGPVIADWRLRRAIPRKAKLLSTVMMGLSWSLLLWLGFPAMVLTISGLCMLAVASYVLTRPSS